MRALALMSPWISLPEKYGSVEALTLRSLCDRSSNVRAAAHKWLLPAIAQWASELQCLTSRLYPSLLKAASVIAKVGSAGLQGDPASNGDSLTFAIRHAMSPPPPE